ncbi:hypothetical protein D6D54_05145 [Spiroplasma poulsonii]|uniref:Uncharacterized protein n=1 Tax=Spiroplasma poulsonii TaxID=2138 RepID=A0A433EQP9_9MOLU|nr:hypothetical protein [Spiroplasma poulsonii]MBW3058965.1 hypothetical protein [Spiroplasma poulsonii]RUP76820.1 hypothetical protein D6D54_05145 [Spiroplasma poulsonii]
MIKKIYLNQNLISQEINNKTHILINKQKDCVVWDKNGLGLSSYKNYFSLEIDENENYVVRSINNKNGNIMGKNLLLSFEKLKQENKKQFNFQSKNDVNNDLLNEYNNHYDNKKIQRKLTETELKKLLEDLENIDNPNYW